MTLFLPTFSSFAQLVDWNHADLPSPQCAYLVRAERPCKCRISQDTCDQAKLLIGDHLELLTGRPDGWDGIYPRIKLLEKLAAMQLCHNHQQHESHAVGQWLKELTGESGDILARLKEYYHFEVDDTYRESEDDTGYDYLSGDDEDTDVEQNASEEEQIYDEEYTFEEEYSSEEEYTSEEGGMFEEEVATEDKDASEEESVREEHEDASAHPRKRSPPIQVLRRALTIQEDEVAKEVTCLLEQPLEKHAKKPGWIYAISPHDIPGKFKVGISFHPPHLQRLRHHKSCYGEFDVLAMRLIPYAYRVEQLVFKELSNQHYMLKKACRKCDKSHRELLDVDKLSLLRCLDKWIRFVQSFPYSNTGKLMKKSKEELPPPALRSYLGCKPVRRRVSGSSIKMKGGSQGSEIVSRQSLGVKVPISDKSYLTVHEVEVNQEELSAAVEDLHIGSSRTKRTVL